VARDAKITFEIGCLRAIRLTFRVVCASVRPFCKSRVAESGPICKRGVAGDDERSRPCPTHSRHRSTHWTGSTAASRSTPRRSGSGSWSPAAVDPEPDLVVTDDQAVLRHPAYGEFRLQVLASRPLSYVSYRWVNPDAEAGTLVEFWIEPREGGVTLRVAESGFSGLGKSREEWLAHREGNVEGWATELAAARVWTERSGDVA
jgi:hypothetical protein